jgi:hypothetical protein
MKKSPDSSDAPPSRRLTIGYHTRDRRRDGFWAGTRKVPYLHLSGVWLQQAGFPIGGRVRLRVNEGCIVIEPE